MNKNIFFGLGRIFFGVITLVIITFVFALGYLSEPKFFGLEEILWLIAIFVFISTPSVLCIQSGIELLKEE